MLTHLIEQFFNAGLPVKAGCIIDASFDWPMTELSITLSVTLISVCVIGYLFEISRFTRNYKGKNIEQGTRKDE